MGKHAKDPKTKESGTVDKEPEEWVSGDDPMTPSQASYLKTLCQQEEDPGAYTDNPTKAEASKRIDDLRAKLRLSGCV